MDEVECEGEENMLSECKHSKREDCRVGEAAGVVCDTTTQQELDLQTELIENCFVRNIGFMSSAMLGTPDTLGTSLQCQEKCRANTECVFTNP